MNKIINSTSKIIAPAVAAAILTATPKVQAGVGDFLAGAVGIAAVATVTAIAFCDTEPAPPPPPPPPPAHHWRHRPPPPPPPAYRPAPPPPRPAYRPEPRRPDPPRHTPKAPPAPKGHGKAPGKRR